MTKKEAIHFLYQIADEIQSFLDKTSSPKGQVQIRAKYFVTDNIYLYPDMFGKTVFLTCAEAEAAIEARKGGKE